MLATGRSVVQSVNAILKSGMPRFIHIMSVVAVEDAILHVNSHVKVPHSLYTCALDRGLDERFYIIPGLGDAGDLSFGEKR